MKGDEGEDCFICLPSLDPTSPEVCTVASTCWDPSGVLEMRNEVSFGAWSWAEEEGRGTGLLELSPPHSSG